MIISTCPQATLRSENLARALFGNTTPGLFETSGVGPIAPAVALGARSEASMNNSLSRWALITRRVSQGTLVRLHAPTLNG